MFKRFRLTTATILFLILTLSIFLTNYTPGTYLTGWDNLQTELSPFLAVKRAIFGVWQEHQSFGLVSGLAHPADFVRALFMWGISFILPQSFQRYFFHTLMVFIGSLGMFRLLQELGLTKHRSFAAMLGSVFYVVNLGTVQIFALPWEAFSIFFGLLPWEIWIVIKILHTPRVTRKDWLTLFLINLLATPQAYVQTVFVVYMMLIVAIQIGFFLTHSPSTVKRSFHILLLIVLVNSFWLLPQMYFFKNNSHVVTEAKINQLSTEDTFYLNQEKGNVDAFVRMEGFYYDTSGLSQTFIFSSWKDHFQNDLIKWLPYVFFAVATIGIYQSKKYRAVFILPWIIVAIALLTITPPFSWINQMVRWISIFNQIFRSPFTKFIIPHALITSVFSAFGIDGINHIFGRIIKQSIISKITLLLGIFILVVYAWPIWQGNFFAKNIRVAIPPDYFELMRYFRLEDKNKRIALLPAYTHWGWFKNRWGYDGSGFLWYGIEQPIVARTFDVWSDKSESFFWELKQATEVENSETFNKVLDKYAIDYLVLDTSLIPIAGSHKGMQYDSLTQLLGNNPRIQEISSWKNVKLYQINRNMGGKNFIQAGQNLPNIGPQIKLTDEDVAFNSYGPYITTKKTPLNAYYPYLDLLTTTELPNNEWVVSETQDSIIIQTEMSQLNTDDLNINTPISNQVLLPKDGSLQVFEYGATTSIEENQLMVRVPKNLVQKIIPSTGKVTPCDSAFVLLEQFTQGESLLTHAKDNTTGCFGYISPDLYQRYGYMLKIQSKNIRGRPLFFYILDNTSQHTLTEALLHNQTEYFLLNRNQIDGIGYSFSFQNKSYALSDAVNQLDVIEVYMFPIEKIKNIALTNNLHPPTPGSITNNIEAQKLNYFLYSLQTSNDTNQTIILNQAFDSGWLAFTKTHSFPYVTRLTDHVLVNNWANGWQLPSQEYIEKSTQKDTVNSSLLTVYLLFWPQILELVGFGLLLVPFLYLCTKK